MEIDVRSPAKTVLVFGATGQQGGSVATALRSHGWQVKALVRDPKSEIEIYIRGLNIVSTIIDRVRLWKS
jgi:uncharacterized protein YbjT (DUF2867 family)